MVLRMETMIAIGLGILLLVALGIIAWLWSERLQLRAAHGPLVDQRVEANRERDRLRAELSASQQDMADAQANVASLATRLEELQNQHAEKIQAYEDAKASMADAFKALSADLLQKNNDQFLKQAKELMGRTQEKSAEAFEQRQKSIDDLIKPINESLTKYDQRLGKIEDARKEANAAIKQQVETIQKLGEGLRSETGQLVAALRSPYVRGQWGEVQLRRVVELAGMIEHCDFQTQTQVTSDDGNRHRPDMIISLPGDRKLVIDAKTPLDAYQHAISAKTDDLREAFLVKHAEQIRSRVSELSNKAYWDQFPESPEFVIMFVPGDMFLSEALRLRPTLLDEALRNRVILATPASLIALLKAVQYGWQQQRIAQDAIEIIDHARTLHDRLCNLTQHIARVGDALGKATKAYNGFIGSFDNRVMPHARRFEDLHMSSGKSLAGLDPVDEQPRESRVKGESPLLPYEPKATPPTQPSEPDTPEAPEPEVIVNRG